MKQIIWTDYFKYRVALRGFNLSAVEQILRHGTERYHDTATGRLVAVGKDADVMVIIPHKVNADNNIITPITIHATNRQQINYRIKSGRFQHE